MTIKEAKCDLCNLPVKVEGFTLTISGRTLEFCCEGCLSVYRMLYSEHFANEMDDCDDKT